MRWLLVAATLFIGCGGPVYDGPAWAELGIGELAFEPLADGAEVPLWRGLQGGRHLFGAVRAGNLRLTGVHLIFTVYREGDSETIAARTEVADLTLATGGAGERAGVPLVLSRQTWTDTEPLCSFRVDVTGGDGRTASARRSMRLGETVTAR